MGHGDGRVQARYRHLLDEQVAKDAAAIEKYLSGGRSGKVVPMPTGALPHS